jgi:hypothetical protein
MTADQKSQKLQIVSAINRSLSTKGILSRSTGGGRKGFSSSSACLDFDTISSIVPTNKQYVSGVNWTVGEGDAEATEE